MALFPSSPDGSEVGSTKPEQAAAGRHGGLAGGMDLTAVVLDGLGGPVDWLVGPSRVLFLYFLSD